TLLSIQRLTLSQVASTVVKLFHLSQVVKIQHGRPPARKFLWRRRQLLAVFANHLQKKPRVKERFQNRSGRLSPRVVGFRLEALAGPRFDEFQEKRIEWLFWKQRLKLGHDFLGLALEPEDLETLMIKPI